MSLLILIFILCLGFTTSFLGVTAGGAGILRTSILVLLGVPHAAAVASSRIGVLTSSVAAIRQFHRARKIEYRVAFFTVLSTTCGSAIGAVCLNSLPDGISRKLLAFASLVFVATGAIQRPKEANISTIHLNARHSLGYGLFAFVGFWANFAGAGGAMIGNSLLVRYFGKTFLEAAATRQLATLFSALTGFPIFLAKGLVNPELAVVLAFGMTGGSFAGTSFALHRGDHWVKAAILIVAVVSGVGLLLLPAS